MKQTTATLQQEAPHDRQTDGWMEAGVGEIAVDVRKKEVHASVLTSFCPALSSALAVPIRVDCVIQPACLAAPTAAIICSIGILGICVGIALHRICQA